MDLDARARTQSGVITRAQALTELSVEQIRWRLRRGEWLRVHPGVYQVHSGPIRRQARLVAALLYYGPDAVLSRETAAHLWGIETREPTIIHIDLPHGRHVVRLPGVRVRRRRRLASVTHRGRPLTAPAFTVLDLADHPTVSRDDAIAVVARAVQRRVVTVDELASELRARRTHRHREALELALGVVAAGAESGLEVAYHATVIRAHGLPPMRMAVPDAVGGSAIRRDFVNETFGVIAEVDGRLGHEADGRARDARRDRKTLARGMVTARQTWGEVRFTPCELAADLFGIYRSRGYAGVLTPCSPTCGAARDASAAPSAPAAMSDSRGGLVLP